MTPEHEEWRPVVGYEGRYEVSDQGRVRSLRAGVVLSSRNNGRYAQVTLKVNGQQAGRKVHWLVAEAFLGPRPDGLVVCHNNDDGFDNRLENLRYDTQSANNIEAVERGRHWQTRKTHCKRNHPLSGDNLAPRSRENYRVCRTCQRERDQRRRRKAAA